MKTLLLLLLLVLSRTAVADHLDFNQAVHLGRCTTLVELSKIIDTKKLDSAALVEFLQASAERSNIITPVYIERCFDLIQLNANRRHRQDEVN